MQEIILEKGFKIKIQFPAALTYGSLRPIKRGGKADYFCRECFNATHAYITSIIKSGTPHWTQSVYIDGIQESRQQTRLCAEHARLFIIASIPQELLEASHVTADAYADMLLKCSDRIQLDKESLRQMYEMSSAINQ